MGVNSDFRMTLHWSAKEQEWRVYEDNGDYWIAKSLSEIPTAVAGLLRGDVRDTLRMLDNLL
jgi:hypothetical protein